MYKRALKPQIHDGTDPGEGRKSSKRLLEILLKPVFCSYGSSRIWKVSCLNGFVRP